MFFDRLSALFSLFEGHSAKTPKSGIFPSRPRTPDPTPAFGQKIPIFHFFHFDQATAQPFWPKTPKPSLSETYVFTPDPTPAFSAFSRKKSRRDGGFWSIFLAKFLIFFLFWKKIAVRWFLGKLGFLAKKPVSRVFFLKKTRETGVWRVPQSPPPLFGGFWGFLGVIFGLGPKTPDFGFFGQKSGLGFLAKNPGWVFDHFWPKNPVSGAFLGFWKIFSKNPGFLGARIYREFGAFWG